jgi:HD-like signal output (HDOD) protein
MLCSFAMNTDKMAELISSDPALLARAFKIVNSASRRDFPETKITDWIGFH